MNFLNENLCTGVMITFIGMVVVMCFLTIMILVMNISSKFILYLNKIFPPEIPQDNKTKVKKKAKTDDEIALAIALAFNEAQKS